MSCQSKESKTEEPKSMDYKKILENEEVKAFLKTVSKKQLEYLRIYDENKNEVRKSAWVG